MFSFIMVENKLHFDVMMIMMMMMMMSALYFANTLGWEDMSLYSDTLSCFRANQYFLLFLISW